MVVIRPHTQWEVLWFKTFANCSKTAKFAKVFTHEWFLLYSMLCVCVCVCVCGGGGGGDISESTVKLYEIEPVAISHHKVMVYCTHLQNSDVLSNVLHVCQQRVGSWWVGGDSEVESGKTIKAKYTSPIQLILHVPLRALQVPYSWYQSHAIDTSDTGPIPVIPVPYHWYKWYRSHTSWSHTMY